MTELNERLIEFEKNNQKISAKNSELINMDPSDFDSIFNYDLSNSRNTIDKLDINLGSTDIPRISCANHKLNLCVRSAVAKHPIVENNLSLIRQFVVKIKKCPRLSDLFEDAKCRLRTENDTRWGSTYLQLEMIHKAYERNCFNSTDERLELPVSIKTIRQYLFILSHLYKVNLVFQTNHCSIGDLIPTILSLIQKLEDIKPRLSISCQQFISLIIQEVKTRFDYELNSNLYLVIFKNLVLLNVKFKNTKFRLQPY